MLRQSCIHNLTHIGKQASILTAKRQIKNVSQPSYEMAQNDVRTTSILVYGSGPNVNACGAPSETGFDEYGNCTFAMRRGRRREDVLLIVWRKKNEKHLNT